MLFVCRDTVWNHEIFIDLLIYWSFFFLTEKEKVGTSNKDNMYETYVSYIHMTLFFYLESINLGPQSGYGPLNINPIWRRIF